MLRKEIGKIGYCPAPLALGTQAVSNVPKCTTWGCEGGGETDINSRQSPHNPGFFIWFCFLDYIFNISHYILKCYLYQPLLYHTSKFVVIKGSMLDICKSKEMTKTEKEKQQWELTYP